MLCGQLFIWIGLPSFFSELIIWPMVAWIMDLNWWQGKYEFEASFPNSDSNWNFSFISEFLLKFHAPSLISYSNDIKIEIGIQIRIKSPKQGFKFELRNQALDLNLNENSEIEHGIRIWIRKQASNSNSNDNSEVELGCSILERKTAFNWKTNIPRGFLKKCYDDLGWSFYVK